jgi:MbtH protein
LSSILDGDGPFVVVRNDDLQHALWPAQLVVPAGWFVVRSPAPREACLAYVREHWTDMRPLCARVAQNG